MMFSQQKKLIAKKLTPKKVVTAGLVIVFVVLCAYSISKYTRGQGLLPFGGLVTSSIFCTGNGNFLLTVSGPAGGLFAYDPRHPQAYESFNLGPGSGMWALGLYTPVPTGCFMQAAPTDILIPSQGIISPTVGTSISF